MGEENKTVGEFVSGEPETTQEQHDTQHEEQPALADLSARIDALSTRLDSLQEDIRQCLADLADLQPFTDAVREVRRVERRPKEKGRSWLHKRLW